MGKFIVDVVHDFGSSPQPDVGRGFLYVSDVFLYLDILVLYTKYQCLLLGWLC